MCKVFNETLDKSTYGKFLFKMEKVETNTTSADGSEINSEEDDWIISKDWLLVVERQVAIKFLAHQPWDYSYIVFSLINRHKYDGMKFVYETKSSIFRWF